MYYLPVYNVMRAKQANMDAVKGSFEFENMTCRQIVVFWSSWGSKLNFKGQMGTAD